MGPTNVGRKKRLKEGNDEIIDALDVTRVWMLGRPDVEDTL